MKQQMLQALRDALAKMNDKGAHWTQGTMRDEGFTDGSPLFCSLGAIYEVTGVDTRGYVATGGNVEFPSETEELRIRLIQALEDAIPEGERPYSRSDSESGVRVAEWNITEWNDYSDRRWPEIVEWFERAQEQVAALDD